MVSATRRHHILGDNEQKLVEILGPDTVRVMQYDGIVALHVLLVNNLHNLEILEQLIEKLQRYYQAHLVVRLFGEELVVFERDLLGQFE